MARFEHDLQLAAALALGASVEQAARQAGVSTRTAWRRLKNPNFTREIARVRSLVVERAVSELVGLAGKAIRSLEQLLESSCEPVRLGAIKAVLDNLRRAVAEESPLVPCRVEQPRPPAPPTDEQLEELATMATKFRLWPFIGTHTPANGNGDGDDTGGRCDEE